MTLKNNGAHLLYNIKLCASFHSHQCIKTGVTVWKHPIWVKISKFFSCVTLKFNSLEPHSPCWTKAWSPLPACGRDCQKPCSAHFPVDAGFERHFRTLLLPPKQHIFSKYLSDFMISEWVFFVKIWMQMASNNIKTQTMINKILTYFRYDLGVASQINASTPYFCLNPMAIQSKTNILMFLY